jgi:hypothetical protein
MSETARLTALNIHAAPSQIVMRRDPKKKEALLNK